ncbi:MAG: peptidase M15 [Sphingopyxis sp.]|nr:MAG: peptidase M15 [Sphingopyxis sp.]
MSRFKLSKRSLDRLEGVHPDLVKVVMLAITLTEVDFGVTEGLRTVERQRVLKAAGASQTMNSRHITGHAVDLVAYIGADISWDWPLYYKIADAMKRASKSLAIPVVWGGDWTSFKDGPHFELSRRSYPA